MKIKIIKANSTSYWYAPEDENQIGNIFEVERHFWKPAGEEKYRVMSGNYAEEYYIDLDDVEIIGE